MPSFSCRNFDTPGATRRGLLLSPTTAQRAGVVNKRRITSESFTCGVLVSALINSTLPPHAKRRQETIRFKYAVVDMYALFLRACQLRHSYVYGSDYRTFSSLRSVLAAENSAKAPRKRAAGWLSSSRAPRPNTFSRKVPGAYSVCARPRL